MNGFIEAIEKMKAIAEILCYTTCKPGCLELEYAMALDIADAADVDVLDVLEFVKKLSVQTHFPYEECIDIARQYFTSGDYNIYSPDKYVLYYTHGLTCIIPHEDVKPIQIIVRPEQRKY